MPISVKTDKKRQVIDITDLVEAELKDTGLVNIFVKHTTCAITTADLDPGTDQDYLKALEKITPGVNWQHPHDPGHFPDHLWAAIIGPGVTISFQNGKPQLGSWQRIILIELDGPRERQVEVTLL